MGNVPFENPFVQAVEGLSSFWRSQMNNPKLCTCCHMNVGISAPCISEVLATAEPPHSPSQATQLTGLFSPLVENLHRWISTASDLQPPVLLSPQGHTGFTTAQSSIPQPIVEEEEEGEVPPEEEHLDRG